MGDASHRTSRFGLVGSVGLHVAAWLCVASLEPRSAPLELIEFEVAELPPAEPPEEEPPEEEPPEEPELEAPEVPDDETEPPPEPPPRSPPKPKPRPKSSEPPPETTAPEEPPELPPPPRIELPADQTIQGDSGVKVHTGRDARPGRSQGSKGDLTGKPGAQGREGGVKEGKGDAEPPWAPKSDLYIARLPHTVHVPEIACPAVRELGISGTVVLTVQVRRDGSIRSVKVAKGIGHGCDAIAIKALRKAKFKPALATDGKPTDYELRYEYEFELDR